MVFSEDSVILRANRVAARWLGYAAEELAGRPLHAVLGAGGQLFLQSQILPTLKFQGNMEEVYLRMRGKSDESVPVLANFERSAIDGEPPRIVLSFLRIRQRGHLEDELVRAKKLAEQASDAKTKFLGMMSHELRTPLQFISLTNQLLASGDYGEMNEEQRAAVAACAAETAAVVTLIDDILDFAKMQGGPVQVSLGDIPVQQAFARVEASARHRFEEAGLQLGRSGDAEDWCVRGDSHRLQQVLLNFINNALKFTPRGGTVTLSARRDGAFGSLAVTDTGGGIPADQVHRIFEPFVQLQTSINSKDKKGVGLGLAICSDLARAMGGRLRVESTVGRGSTFSIELPLSA